MIKKILMIVVLILMFIGIYFGICFSIKSDFSSGRSKQNENNILNMIQTKPAEALKFYTYGKAFNICGKISNVSKDNFEGAKLVITDGLDYEKSYNLNYKFENNDLIFESDTEINSGIILDDLENSNYYILLRLKLNNSADPKYYSFENKSENTDVTYYTVTKNGKNFKVTIQFIENVKDKNTYKLLKLSKTEDLLPEEVYDIVIDAGHGGKDQGENAGQVTEADITLEYAKSLKQSLEEIGYKVKLTRDDQNSSSFSSTNMYDENGRISIACKTKAKLMISFHINQGGMGLRGIEIYCPSKSNLDFAKIMASKVKEYSTIEYSNNNSFKKADGVYVRGFTKQVMDDFESTAKSKGYEPYNITSEIPFLYTIREVGGIATNAYVDGRNKAYSKNEYYKSNQGIECYQIELGYIKRDLEIIKNEKENYIRAIVEAVQNNY